MAKAKHLGRNPFTQKQAAFQKSSKSPKSEPTAANSARSTQCPMKNPFHFLFVALPVGSVVLALKTVLKFKDRVVGSSR